MAFENDSLESLVQQYSERDLPPVEQWQPTSERDSDIRIDASGRWFYRGSSIDRARMVALFSTILRKEEISYFLVTPHEKLRIEVEDVPFVVQLLEISGSGEQQNLLFTDNAGNRFTADKQHKLWVEHNKDESRPYCIVRNNLAALLARPVYYQLADLITEQNSRTGVYSGGVFFPLD